MATTLESSPEAPVTVVAMLLGVALFPVARAGSPALAGPPRGDAAARRAVGPARAAAAADPGDPGPSTGRPARRDLPEAEPVPEPRLPRQRSAPAVEARAVRLSQAFSRSATLSLGGRTNR